MHDQNEALERLSSQSQQSREGQDILRMVEEYSKQNEHKAKEIEQLILKCSQHKVSKHTIKKSLNELEQKNLRLQSKLDHMGKFCRIFIKSIKKENVGLNELVKQQQQETRALLHRCQSEFIGVLETKCRQIRSHWESIVSQRDQQLLQLKDGPRVSQLEQEVNRLQDKLKRYKVGQSSELNQQKIIDKLEAKLEANRLAQSVVEREKDSVIQGLKEQLQRMIQKEQELVSKLETVDGQARAEYQRLVEIHEGGGRYREVRDLYEDKLGRVQKEMIETKEELVRVGMRYEWQSQERTKLEGLNGKLQLACDQLQSQLDAIELKMVATEQKHCSQLDLLRLDLQQLTDQNSQLIREQRDSQEVVSRLTSEREQNAKTMRQTTSDLECRLSSVNTELAGMKQRVVEMTVERDRCLEECRGVQEQHSCLQQEYAQLRVQWVESNNQEMKRDGAVQTEHGLGVEIQEVIKTVEVIKEVEVVKEVVNVVEVVKTVEVIKEVIKEVEVVREVVKEVEAAKEVDTPSFKTQSSPRQEESKTAVKPVPLNPAQAQAQTGVYGIFSSFMSLLTKKQQAFVGKPASAMYYDDKKKRWVIAGEAESDDDVPPPPPPKAVQPKKEEVKEAVSEATGLDSLTKATFAGNFNNRKRPVSKKPQVSLPPFTPELAQHPEKPQLPETQLQLDETTNQTMMTANDTLSASMIMQQQDHAQREQDLLQKLTHQQDKISSLRYQVSHLTEALQAEKQQQQQTISELEQFSSHLQKASQQHQQQLEQSLQKEQQSLRQIQELESLLELAQTNQQNCEHELEQCRDVLRQTRQQLLQEQVRWELREETLPVQQQVIDTSELEDQIELLKWQLCLSEQAKHRQRQDLEGQLAQQQYELQKQLEEEKAKSKEFALVQLQKAVQQKDQQHRLKENQLKQQYDTMINQLQSDTRHLHQSRQFDVQRIQEMEQRLVSMQRQSKDDQERLRVLERQLKLTQERGQGEQTHLKEVLNGHIVYLQEEIRKRDDLLSDQDDQDDWSTKSGSNELRKQIKQLSEQIAKQSKQLKQVQREHLQVQSQYEQVTAVLGQDPIAQYFCQQQQWDTDRLSLQKQIHQLQCDNELGQGYQFDLQLARFENEQYEEDVRELDLKYQAVNGLLGDKVKEYNQIVHQHSMLQKQFLQLQQDSEVESQQYQEECKQLQMQVQKGLEVLSQVTGRKNILQIDNEQLVQQVQQLQAIVHGANQAREQLEIELQSANDQSLKQQSESQAMQGEVSELREDLASKEQLLQQSKQDLEQAQIQLQQLTIDFDKVASAFVLKKKGWKEQMRVAKDEVAVLKGQLEMTEQGVSLETEQIVQKCVAKVQKYKQEKQRLQEVVQELEGFKQQCEKLTLDLENLQSFELELRSRVASKDQELGSLREALMEHKREYQLLQSESNQSEQLQVQQLTNDLDSCKAEINQLKDSLAKSNQQVQDHKAEFESLKQDLATANNELTSLRIDLQASQSQVQEHEEGASKLASLFQSKVQELRDKNSKLKIELRSVVQELEQTQLQAQSLQQQLHESTLDLTKISLNQSRVEGIEDKVIKMLQKYTDSVAQDWIEQLAQLLQNGEENKRMIQVLVGEKDELLQDVEGLMYKLNLVQQPQNDLIIKFNTMTEELSQKDLEVSVLKDKVAKLEQNRSWSLF